VGVRSTPHGRVTSYSYKCRSRSAHSGRIVAHSETIVRNHSATACGELVVESQTGRVAASGWCDGITVENSPTPHLSQIGNEKQASLTLSISCLKQSRGPAQGQTACGTPRKDLALRANHCLEWFSHFRGSYPSVRRFSAKPVKCGVMLRSSPVLFFEAAGALSLSLQ
jgi:hypothetical protein